MRVVLLFLLFSFGRVNAQELSRFTDEVATIQKKATANWDSTKETIVFTGSSSIRMWKDVNHRFPENQIINSGFGGSQAIDLLQYTDELILDYNPTKVFIYEGDNDISAKKKPNEIIKTINQIILKIRTKNPNTEIVLISAKPSIARLKLKAKYKRLNRKFNKLSKNDALLTFADVWKPMFEKRKLKKDIFLSDGLHMNTKGYDIWFKVIKQYMQ